MIRYIAMIWNKDIPSQGAEFTSLRSRLLHNNGLRELFSRPGMCIYGCNISIGVDGCLLLPDHGGVILGAIFENLVRRHEDETASAASFDSTRVARIVQSRGQYLADHCWGNYLAFLLDHSSSGMFVFGSPFCDLPCYKTVSKGVQVLFSNIEDCVYLGLRFSINWPYMRSYMLSPPRSRQTGLVEVEALSPGECLVFSPDSVRRQIYWNPISVATADLIDNEEEAKRVANTVSKACIRGLGVLHDNIILSLSGGLDSSIVLACLQDSPQRPQITCLTEYSTDENGDERYFARAAAVRAGCVLIEEQRNEDLRLEKMIDVWQSPVPGGNVRSLETGGQRRRLAHSVGANALFSGTGGDEIFHSMPELAATDFVFRRGLRPGLGPILLRAAHAGGSTVWKILGTALKPIFRTEQYEPLRITGGVGTLVSTETLSWAVSNPLDDPQWRWSTADAPLGKLWQTYFACAPTNRYDPYAQPADPPNISPLRSQPIVETFLRIPTDILTSGGKDRELARQAFARDVPAEITSRYWKCVIERHMMHILKQNLRFARDFLLNGALVRSGLLDQSQLEMALSDTPSGVMKGMAPIYHYLGTEAWLRHWTILAQEKAA